MYPIGTIDLLLSGLISLARSLTYRFCTTAYPRGGTYSDGPPPLGFSASYTNWPVSIALCKFISDFSFRFAVQFLFEGEECLYFLISSHPHFHRSRPRVICAVL